MKIRFVSHASFCVEACNTSLLTDPWLFGKAFNNGWALLSPAAEVHWPEIDYVWISHQHPDHLHFPTLKSIDPQQRRRLTVLYQKHGSARIAKTLEGMGYENVQELTLNRWMPLRNGMEVMCGSVGSMDSWLAVRAENTTILNLNDCAMTSAHLACVARLVGRPDVLFTQFSFANWIGDHADEKGGVEHKLADLSFRVNSLKPDVTIPFASFIYFCNQENCWMNDFAVTPQRVADMKLPGVRFMYPGDEFEPHAPAFREDAVARYMADVARSKPIDPTPAPVEIRNIVASADRMLRTVRSRYGRIATRRIRPFSMYLHDLDKVLLVDMEKGCEARDATEALRENARFVMCSQVAWYAFAYSWGWGAMEVSGMYTDRKWREPFPLAFYLTLLSTEFLDMRGLRQSLRTLQFLWDKRAELTSRITRRLLPQRAARQDGFASRKSLAAEAAAEKGRQKQAA
jgi:hypothetical protein